MEEVKVVMATRRRTSESAPPAAPRSAHRVLVVEDEQDVAELIRYNLAKEGYAVALVGNLDPLWIIVASLAFGVLQSGGIAMQAEAHVPREVVSLIIGLVIIALAGRRVVASLRST